MAQAMLSKDGKRIGLKTDYRDADIVKQLTGGKYEKKKGLWVFPVTSLPDIVSKLHLQTDKVIFDLASYWNTKEILADRIKQGKAICPEHPFLMEHQKKCRALADLFNQYAFFMDTGTGKTVAALQVIKDKPSSVKWLVITPKAIVKTAWWDDQKDFFPEMRLLPWVATMRKEDYEHIAKEWGSKSKLYLVETLLESYAQVVVTNPDRFKNNIETLKQVGFTGLIVDESVMLKDTTTAISKTVKSFVEDMEYVYLMSGKPAPNNELEYFGQMSLVDPCVIGSNLYQYRSKYFRAAGFGGYSWEIMPGCAEQIAGRLNKRSYFVSKDECLDLPPKSYATHMVELPSKARSYYREMERERVLDLLDDHGKIILAPNKLTSIMKLRQITSGFVMDDAKNAIPIHNAKVDELLTTLETIGDKPVIIWCEFRREIKLLEKILTDKGRSVVTAYGETKNVDDSIRAFQSGQAQVMLAHPKSLKYGVTFTHCTYAIYYSLSHSFDDYYQSHDRIYRNGQRHNTHFIFLIGENTIDEVILASLQGKGKLSTLMENYCKEVSKEHVKTT